MLLSHCVLFVTLLLHAQGKRMWRWFTFMSNTLVRDWTDCSRSCLNVIFHCIPPDKVRDISSLSIRKIKHRSVDEYVTAFFHFSFPYVNIVVLEEYHFSKMQEYIFLSCQDFLKLIPRVTHSVCSQTVRAKQRRHLWWSKQKSLWCSVSLWGWFQLLCAPQGRPPTTSPTKLEMAPVHLPYS